MSAETADSDDPTPPKFRGCVFCYSAEWAYYGAKRAIGSVSGSQSSQ